MRSPSMATPLPIPLEMNEGVGKATAEDHEVPVRSNT